MKRSRLAAVGLLLVSALGASGCSVLSAFPSAPTTTAPVTGAPTSPAAKPSAPVPSSPAPSATPTPTPTMNAEGRMQSRPEGIATSVENELEKQVGRRPKVDCGSEPVWIAPGDTLPCSLTDGSDVYDVAVTITHVTPDGTFVFDFEVAQTPRK
ncbi:hypothetical protein G7070_08725 [Propioniciclava coleopterorum]|uniref:DUF4333 domain-containing protein n=1 Tax=Propioniciclava coleopterorum TaxID=2714937 RepID=A0A6G7Y6J9_9ACTN|nr:hypothetical protein [Propioniciclava coleopterorum]QIK72339.1 hypothetical protein G7070_08725 [Propioniciclava coleopterorum]